MSTDPLTTKEAKLGLARKKIYVLSGILVITTSLLLLKVFSVKPVSQHQENHVVKQQSPATQTDQLAFNDHQNKLPPHVTSKLTEIELALQKRVSDQQDQDYFQSEKNSKTDNVSTRLSKAEHPESHHHNDHYEKSHLSTNVHATPIAPEVIAAVNQLTHQTERGTEMSTLDDGNIIVDMGDHAFRAVPVATVDDKGNISITEYMGPIETTENAK